MCMLFIHQQIQSFLHLGACKEYPVMAKPKSPNSKKSNDLKPTVSTTNSPLPVPTNGRAAAAAAAAAPAMETSMEANAAATTATAGRKTETRKNARKPEIVKAEARANLVPISV